MSLYAKNFSKVFAMFFLIRVLASLLGGDNPNLHFNNGRKGPVDDRDLWYFEQGWLAQEAEASADVRQARYLDCADAHSLITVLQAAPGTAHSQPFVNALRKA
jgi:hypothetical protein